MNAYQILELLAAALIVGGVLQGALNPVSKY